MTALDIGLISLVLFSALFGIIRGLTRECLGLISWGSAIVLAYLTSPFAKQFARSYISNPALADATTLFATFLIFLIILSLVSHLLSNLVRNSVLGGLDRVLGFAFGLIRGLVLIFVIELLLSIFLPRQEYPQSVKESRFFTFIMKGSNTLYSLLPTNLKQMIIEQKGKRVPQNTKALSVTIPQSGGRITAQKIIHNLQPPEKSSAEKTHDLANLKPRNNSSEANNDEATTDVKSYSKKEENRLERLLEHTTDDN